MTPVEIVFVLVTAALGLIGPCISLFVLRDGPLSFHFAFQAILSVAYFLKGLLVIGDPEKYVTYPYAWQGPYYEPRTFMVAAIGVMAMAVAFAITSLPSTQREPAATDPPATSFAKVSMASLRVPSMVLVALAFLAYITLCRAAGIAPISATFYSPLRRTQFLSVLRGNGLLNVSLLTLPLLASPLLVTGRYLSRVAVLGVCFLVLGSIGNRTSLTGLILIFAFGLRPALVQAGWKRLAPMLACLVLATAVIGFRIQGQAGSNPVEIVGRFSLGFDGYDNLSGVLQLDRVDAQLGSSVVEDAVYAFVPRSVFPGKAEFYGNARLQQIVFPAQGDVFGTRASFPVSIFGEGFLSFGVLGVVLFGAAAGLIARLGDHLLRLRDRGRALAVSQAAGLFLFGAAINMYRSLGMYLQLVLLSGVGFLLLIGARAAIDRTTRLLRL